MASASLSYWPCLTALSDVTIDYGAQWPLDGLGHIPLGCDVRHSACVNIHFQDPEIIPPPHSHFTPAVLPNGL